MATEDDEDDEDLLPAEMHAEPASTAEAAQRAAQAAGQVKQAHIQERTRLEEDAIGALPHGQSNLSLHTCQLVCTYAVASTMYQRIQSRKWPDLPIEQSSAICCEDLDSLTCLL